MILSFDVEPICEIKSYYFLLQIPIGHRKPEPPGCVDIRGERYDVLKSYRRMGLLKSGTEETDDVVVIAMKTNERLLI